MSRRTRFDPIADQILNAYTVLQAVGHRERTGQPTRHDRDEARRTLTTIGAAVPEMIEDAKKALDERDHGHGKT